MALKPLADNVIVKMVEEEGITRKGLILSPGSKKLPIFAQVIAVGENVDTVKVDDLVIIEKYAGSEIVLDRDTKYLVVKLDQVLCIAVKELAEKHREILNKITEDVAEAARQNVYRFTAEQEVRRSVEVEFEVVPPEKEQEAME